MARLSGFEHHRFDAGVRRRAVQHAPDVLDRECGFILNQRDGEFDRRLLR